MFHRKLLGWIATHFSNQLHGGSSVTLWCLLSPADDCSHISGNSPYRHCGQLNPYQHSATKIRRCRLHYLLRTKMWCFTPSYIIDQVPLSSSSLEYNPTIDSVRTAILQESKKLFQAFWSCFPMYMWLISVAHGDPPCQQFMHGHFRSVTVMECN